MRISKFNLAVALAIFVAITASARTFTRFSFSQSGEGGNSKTTLTINADGTAKLVREASLSRQMAEDTARAWDQIRNRADTDDSDDATPQAKPDAKAEPKPMTDEELEKKLRATFENAEENFGMSQGKLDKLEVSKEEVTTVTTQTFANLEELMGASYMVWGQSALSVQDAKIEKDANDHLKLTLTPQKLPKRFATEVMKFWKTSKSKIDFQMVFPDKVISSSFPDVNGNTTGFTIDGAKPESIEALSKLNTNTIVVVAELGGLKIDKPVEARSAQQAMFRPQDPTASNVPITEGGEGFTAEASSVTTMTSYEFPEAQKKSGRSFYPGAQEEGTTVMAKIFGPKDRTLQSVRDIRILKAVDDKGREIPKPSSSLDDFSAMAEGFDYTPFNKKAANSKQVSVRLGLPEPDAKSIEEVTLQAVVQSVGAWKEMTIPLEEGKTNEVDLAQVLPGAKLTIKKANFKSMQVSVDGNVKGPAEIQQLDFQIKPEGNPDAFQMQPDYNQWNRSRDKTTRKVMLRGFMMQQGAGAKNMTLVVRYPTDTKRQRLEFKLTGLDLF